MKNHYSERTHRLIEFDNKLRGSISLSGADSAVLCGVDEAGRGPVAGPVVAAAVIFSDDVYIEGVFDSKKVTKSRRKALYEEIIDSARAYSVGIVSNTDIDEINILEATKRAIDKAVSRLRVTPGLIAADGNFYSNPITRVENYIKGDEKSFSIAAASIIAKVTRDRMMEEYERDYPHFSFSAHKGYGTKKHIDEILEYGFTAIHRKSFKIKQLQGELF